MNRESIIKEFEEETGNNLSKVHEMPTAFTMSEFEKNYWRDFANWLLSKVIAQGEENERLNSVMRVDKEIKRKSDKAGIELSSDFIKSNSELKSLRDRLVRQHSRWHSIEAGNSQTSSEQEGS